MKKSVFLWGTLLFILSLTCFPLFSGNNNLLSLSQVMRPGLGLLDSDGDHWPDKIAWRIILPENPSAAEIAAAADVAARFNFESLAVNMNLVFSSPFESPRPSSFLPIYLEIVASENTSLSPHQAKISLSGPPDSPRILVQATSADTLLQACRAFFLRWPYLWEIWGRENGLTYNRVEKDVLSFLQENGLNQAEISIQAVLYQFQPPVSPFSSLKKLRFDENEIKEMLVEIKIKQTSEYRQAVAAFRRLNQLHRRGEKSHLLSYPGCAGLTFLLSGPEEKTRVSIPRLGFPGRLLTPRYKSVRPARIKGKDFDLTSFFTTKGVYQDSDKDGLHDGIDSQIIIPQDFSLKEVTSVASRFVLDTAGASFPLVFLDKEITEPQRLVAPLLIGHSNRLIQKLIKQGQLKKPSFEANLVLFQVVPRAFNDSATLVILENEPQYLGPALQYFSRTFPYFKEYREGAPQISDLTDHLQAFLKGKSGGAEAYFLGKIDELIDQLQGTPLESLEVKLASEQPSSEFIEYLQTYLQEKLNPRQLVVKPVNLQESRVVFSREKAFTWEGEVVQQRVARFLASLPESAKSKPLFLSLGLSESPAVRQKIKAALEKQLAQAGLTNSEVEVLSAYKQGFFWLTEKILPRLKKTRVKRILIKVARVKVDRRTPQRFYSEPLRWLQELYPVDEIMAKTLDLPLSQVVFELKEPSPPIYEIQAFNQEGGIILEEQFTPQTTTRTFLDVLPEWGQVTVSTGWLQIKQGGQTVLQEKIPTDLEKIWDLYQKDILPEVYKYILKKTQGEPTLAKQPYFKRLLVEIWASEPDFRLGLDEELISSLESIHDEIYFDTLDFCRGITEVVVEEEPKEDTSRYNAPGNVMPLIHPSTEGEPPRVKVSFEDWPGKSPFLQITWQIQDRPSRQKKFTFPRLKPKKIQIPAFYFNGEKKRLEKLIIEVEAANKKEYFTLLKIIQSFRRLVEKRHLNNSFTWPNLKQLVLRLKGDSLEKEEILAVKSPPLSREKLRPAEAEGSFSIPTQEIISPEMCLKLAARLGQSPWLRMYIAGESREKRPIPVLEAFLPRGPYPSRPRLIMAKPVLYGSGRQHANEVSSTNYILKLAELIATKKEYQELLKKINLVLHPMENPDGAALAYDLQKLTPHHSLHAGRYSSLGMDIGYQVGAKNPLLPEAKVRGSLFAKWRPDIHLNLHGYPSHEWVQQFSDYSPYLFRDYWIPRGWFAYVRGIQLPLYRPWKQATEGIIKLIVEELNRDPQIKKANQKFYDRYYRWAARWQPHLDYLELYEGVNLYVKRRSSRESLLTERQKITFLEETPELMDETARGEWLDFLCRQGLAYLRAHLRFLAETKWTIVRIDEESNQRIRLRFLRGRPGEKP